MDEPVRRTARRAPRRSWRASSWRESAASPTALVRAVRSTATSGMTATGGDASRRPRQRRLASSASGGCSGRPRAACPAAVVGRRPAALSPVRAAARPRQPGVGRPDHRHGEDHEGRRQEARLGERGRIGRPGEILVQPGRDRREPGRACRGSAGTPNALIENTNDTTSADRIAGRRSGRVTVRSVDPGPAAGRPGGALEIRLARLASAPATISQVERQRRHRQDEDDPERAVQPGHRQSERPVGRGRAGRTPGSSRTRAHERRAEQGQQDPRPEPARGRQPAPLRGQGGEPSRPSRRGSPRAPPSRRLFDDRADVSRVGQGRRRPARRPRPTATPRSRTSGRPMNAASRTTASSRRRPSRTSSQARTSGRGSSSVAGAVTGLSPEDRAVLRRAGPSAGRTPPSSRG